MISLLNRLLPKTNEWRNRVFTRIPSDNPPHQCYHKFLTFIVISGWWAMQASWKWSSGLSWEQRHFQWMYAAILHIFRYILFENAIWTASFAILIFHLHEVLNQCKRQGILICLVWNSHAVYMHDFDKSIRQNPDLHHVPLFQNHLLSS